MANSSLERTSFKSKLTNPEPKPHPSSYQALLHQAIISPLRARALSLPGSPQTARGHPYSPELTDITRTSHSWATYSALPSENPNENSDLDFLLAHASSSRQMPTASLAALHSTLCPLFLRSVSNKLSSNGMGHSVLALSYASIN